MTDAAATGGDEAALLASRLAANPVRPGWTRAAFTAGVGGAAYGTVVLVVARADPAALDTPIAVGVRTALAVVVGGACFVTTLWLGIVIRGRLSVMKPLTPPERRAVRRAAVGRDELGAEWSPIVTAHRREVRELSAQGASVAGILAMITALHPDTTGFWAVYGVVLLVVAWAAIVVSAVRSARHRPVAEGR